MTNPELQAHIARIKRSLASPTACTPATAEALFKILLPSPSTAPHARSTYTSSTKQNARLPVTREGKGPSTRSNKRPPVAILEIQEPEEKSLDPAGKFKLATEVVNVTLKQLTEALKTPVLQKPRRRPPLDRTSSESQSRGGSNPGSPVPLQPRSVNRVTSVVSGSSCSRRSSCADQSEHGTSLLALAECTRTAFATIRTLEASGSMEWRMPRLQLETGMSAYIGKLVALGMEELAVKELRVLTKRICTKGERRESIAKRTLVELLHVNNIPSDLQTVSLIVTTQLQVLKLLVLKKRSCSLEAAYNYLQLSNPGSPATLLDQLTAGPSQESRTKAMRQIETLAQLMLSLCPGDSTETERIPSANIVLQYQTLALQLRGKWWKLAGHKIDREKELLSPLVRYLNLFIQRSANADEIVLCVVKSTIDNLSQTLGFLLVPAILQILSDVALKCKNFSDAISYSNLLLTAYSDGNASKARLCGVLCQLAKLRLQLGDLKDETTIAETLAMLLSAVKALKGNLSGDSSDLDELLIQFHSLQKVCLAYLHSNHKMQACEKCCLEFVLLGPKFLIRYVGERPVEMATKDIEERYLKRLRLARQIVLPTVEAIASLAKHPLAENAVVWSTVDLAFQDCVRLLSKFDTWDLAEKRTPSVVSPKNVSPFTLLSNAYWCYYLRQKSLCPNLEDLQSCLRKSIELIMKRPVLEKHAAFLSTKLEKLADLYEQCKQTEKAKATFLEALRAQIAAGSLHIASERAASEPISQVFMGDSGTLILARVLERYAILTCKTASDKQSMQHFDDDQLSDQERGISLEYQFGVLSNRRLPNTHMLKSALRSIPLTLLELYDEERFPVRRLRVMVRILHVHASNNTILEPEFISNILAMRNTFGVTSLGCDSGLKKYLPHLQACREVLSTMISNPPCPEDLEEPIKIWSQLMEEVKEKTSLHEYIDDTSDWLHLLEDIAEYLHMQGCEKQRLSVLRLTAISHGLLCGVADPAYISNLLALSIQYTRLGYSGKASEVLQKVRDHASHKNSSLHMSIRWHIAYSEYLIEIGNSVKW